MPCQSFSLCIWTENVLTLNNRTASLITFILQVTIMKTSPYLVILFLKILVSFTAGQELFRSQNSLGSRRTNFHNDLRSQSQREVFFVNLEDGFFGCQVNASVDILQLFEISKLCDGTPNCYLGSDESNPRLKCTSKFTCHFYLQIKIIIIYKRGPY